MNCKKFGNVFAVMSILITCLALPSYAGGFLKKMIKLEKQQSQSSNSSQQEGKFAIGDEYAGGIIFYIDNSGDHGLVASDTDIRGTRSWDEAVRACSKYEKNGYSDWFLPDREQLAELYLRRDVVGGWVPNSGYWSSTESDIRDCAWMQFFSTGSQYRNFTKNYLYYARAVRAF